MAELDPIVAQLRDRRHTLGLSQRAAAKLAGLSRLTVWRWERGVHTPSYPELLAYATALGVRLEVVVEEKRPAEPPPVAATITVKLIAESVTAIEDAARLTGHSKTDTVNQAVQLLAYKRLIEAAGGALYVREMPGQRLMRMDAR